MDVLVITMILIFNNKDKKSFIRQIWLHTKQLNCSMKSVASDRMTKQLKFEVEINKKINVYERMYIPVSYTHLTLPTILLV